jgi:hypothetical protein
MQQFATVTTFTERFQKYTDLKEEMMTIWQLKAAYITTISDIRNGYYFTHISPKVKTVDLRPGPSWSVIR